MFFCYVFSYPLNSGLSFLIFVGRSALSSSFLNLLSFLLTFFFISYCCCHLVSCDDADATSSPALLHTLCCASAAARSFCAPLNDDDRPTTHCDYERRESSFASSAAATASQSWARSVTRQTLKEQSTKPTHNQPHCGPAG